MTDYRRIVFSLVTCAIRDEPTLQAVFHLLPTLSECPTGLFDFNDMYQRHRQRWPRPIQASNEGENRVVDQARDGGMEVDQPRDDRMEVDNPVVAGGRRNRVKRRKGQFWSNSRKRMIRNYYKGFFGKVSYFLLFCW